MVCPCLFAGAFFVYYAVILPGGGYALPGLPFARSLPFVAPVSDSATGEQCRKSKYLPRLLLLLRQLAGNRLAAGIALRQQHQQLL